MLLDGLATVFNLSNALMFVVEEVSVGLSCMFGLFSMPERHICFSPVGQFVFSASAALPDKDTDTNEGYRNIDTYGVPGERTRAHRDPHLQVS